MTIITFFGAGLRYWICQIPEAEFAIIRERKEANRKTWEHVFFDLDFLEKLGYQNWETIHLLEEGKGWLIAENNRMEIRIDRKKRKVELEQFLGNALFDEYRKRVIAFEVEEKVGFQNVLLLQKDVGMINKFEIDEELLDLDKLVYWFYDGRAAKLDLLWLTKVEYDGQELFDKGDDCLTRQNLVRIL